MTEPKASGHPKAKYGLPPVFKIAAAAVFAGLVAAATLVFVVPIPNTGGYFNLGETIIYVAALILGPLVGLTAGAGAAISDALVAAQYAPGTLAIKAIEGFLVGFLFNKLNRKIKNITVTASISVVVGGFEMVAGYFLYETLVLGVPVVGALAEVPFNLIQMAVGLVIAVPVMHGVLRIFPQLKSQF